MLNNVKYSTGLWHEWTAIKGGLTKDKDIIKQASNASGVPVRTINTLIFYKLNCFMIMVYLKVCLKFLNLKKIAVQK